MEDHSQYENADESEQAESGSVEQTVSLERYQQLEV